MRTAKQFHPSKANLKEKISENKSQGILSYILPKTSSKSSIHSCFGFQIQCRRHRRLRLEMSRKKSHLIKYDEENESSDRQKSLTTRVSIDSHSQIRTTTSNILNKKHRTRRTRDIHLSAMLIGLNILYLLLNLPFNFHQTFVKRFHNFNTNSDRCTIMFINVLLDALQQTFFFNKFLFICFNKSTF